MKQRRFRPTISAYVCAASVLLFVVALGIVALVIHEELHEHAYSGHHFPLRVAAMLFVAVAGLAVGNFLVTRRLLLKPLMRIRDIARLIADHDERLGQQIPVPFGPELEELAQAFNGLSAKLRRERDELEQRIADRTQALVESETRFRSGFENSLDAMFLATPDGKITSANSAACALFGMTEEEICRVGRAGIVDENDPRFKAAMEQRDRTGRTKAEYTHVRRDGARFDAEVSSVIFGERVPRSIIVIRDITERKRVEALLRESEARLRNAFRHAAVGIIIGSPDCHYREVNPAYCKIVGYTPEELAVISYGQIVYPDDWPANNALFQRLIAGEVPDYVIEVRCVRKDGGIVWVRKSVTCFRGGPFEPLRFVGLIEDITDRKRAEEMARAHQREIAHLSRVASVGEMASSLAHELNQPLTAILGYAAACQNLAEASPSLSARTLEYLRAIKREAQRAGEIVRRVRSYVRKQTPEKRIGDINRIVQDAVDLLRHDLQRWSVTLRLEFADAVPPVLADSVQIQQVLINLMQNAMEAMGSANAGERSLTVQTLAVETGVCVRVMDSGLAVAPELMGRIFESFFTTKPHGLGLGLSICRSIIEHHGGRIEASLNRGRGMTFEFTLPYAAPVTR